MIGIPIETAIAAALIGLAGGLVGQFVGAFFGARYAAQLSRKTQIELADLSFQRQWRERLVRPFLEIAAQRLEALPDFTEAISQGNTNGAVAIARKLGRTDAVVHAIGMTTLGDQALKSAADAWMEAAYAAAKGIATLADGPEYTVENAHEALGMLVDLVDVTARLNAESARYVAGENPKPRARLWHFW